MELSKNISDEKKSKPSFWNRLLRLPRKSYLKEKHDETFKRQSLLYSSLNTLKKEKQESSTSKESENFMTLESSALEDVHKDAGILFLNKSSVENCFAPKEENRHVQFVPTPMNKYYNVDVRSAPSIKRDENKENVEQTKSKKPSRPILRLNKKHKTSSNSSSAEDTESNPEAKLVNVTYIDGPEVKTPSMTRTSTKIALVDRKNGSMPQLNVSSIVKYNSLPRNPKIPEENFHFKNNEQFVQQSNKINSTQSLCNQPSILQRADMTQRYRKSMRSLNTHRQSCYGVSDPSRVFEGKKILQAQNHEISQDITRRLSLGPPVHFPHDGGSNRRENIIPRNHSAQEPHKKISCPVSSKSQGINQNPEQYGMKLSKNCPERSNGIKLNIQHYHASTGHIPNKAINEVGLPIACNKNCGTAITSKMRSKSPQYIHLSETSNKVNIINNSNVKAANNQAGQQISTSEFSIETATKKQYVSSCLAIPAQNQKQVCGNADFSQEQSSAITETRKQAILSAMYAQKRKIMNKICKYNSKQSDEGFSSMADDECSFNCSCPSCVSKLSRSYKRLGLKQLFSNSKDKYFFTIEPEIKEGNELGRLPENQTFVGPMTSAQPQLSNKQENKLNQNKTWYDCNDTLCETPTKDSIAEKGISKTPTNKMVENIYENITEIINSATKKNLTPQDVKKLLSTPISTQFKSHKKFQRSLFSDGDQKEIPDTSLKQLQTPDQASDCFNDSIVLLQEIFQKLSQECKELLQPNSTTDISSRNSSTPVSHLSPGSKYVNDLIKNLKSSELSEADFANIIGGIAQNIFSDTKAKKRKIRTLPHSTSLPDLQKKAALLNRAISVANSLKDLCDIQIKEHSKTKLAENISTSTYSENVYSASSGDSALGNRQLPDGWSKTPTTENSNLSTDISSTKHSSSGTEKESSKCSEGEMQILENAIRLGMGLPPLEKVKKTPVYVSSPTKATKYKSRDVLSGKGKLKLKIYYNSGLVTVYVMKAAKLDWTNGRELNAYVKITMVPDESKRVHWRTNVQKAQRNPVFYQRFSFELLAEDVTKRLVFSVWHRDYAKQRSELIGCMSFSVRHVMDNTHNVDGWYRLLRERFGTQKHFAAHTKKNCSSKK